MSHHFYLIETAEKPTTLSVDDPAISKLIEPYCCENDPEKVNWDWCAVGGGKDGAIPGNCCLGKDIPEGFEPDGLITADGVIDNDWWYRGFPYETIETPLEDEAEEEARIARKNAEAETIPLFLETEEQAESPKQQPMTVAELSAQAQAKFREQYRVDPDRWYTLIDFHI